MRFNGVELRSVHRALSIEKEIPPGTAARKTETIDGADGEVVSEERLTQGEYLVKVNIVARTREEGWAVRELLAEWASLPHLGTAELVPTPRPQRCYDARLKSIGDPEFIRGGAKIDVRFLLPRPVARETEQSRTSGAGSIRARIGGSYAARPVLSQTLKTAQDTLRWTMDGKPILTLTETLRAGQRVEMDTKTGALLVDGKHAEHLIDVEGTYWRPGYLPGLHEIASTDGGTIEMRWHNEWL